MDCKQSRDLLDADADGGWLEGSVGLSALGGSGRADIGRRKGDVAGKSLAIDLGGLRDVRRQV